MRLAKTELVCGMDPQVARAVARECSFRDMGADGIAYKLKVTPDEAGVFLEALNAGGYLMVKPHAEVDGGVVTSYATTISGGALAQATFSKPISRKKADELLAGLVERAAEFNELPGKPLFVERVTVFGSYLDPDAQNLGDLDVHVKFAPRTPGAADAKKMLDYAYASDRTFRNMVEALGWGEREATLYLRNKSQYTRITTEDISSFTSKVQVVYERLTG